MVEIHRDESLIDRPGSRGKLSTPALLVDLDQLEKNIQTMALYCREKGIALRPHCKAHKCVELAKCQIKAGAIGISCVTLLEAETMVQEKMTGVLITSPVITPDKIKRLAAINLQAEDLMVVVDHPDNVEALDQASRAKPLQILVDFDVGQNRTGAKSVAQAMALARQIAASPNLVFKGIQAYAGHLQSVPSYQERKQLICKQTVFVKELCEQLKQAGLPPKNISGGGTGSFQIDISEGVFTEIQAGSYIFMDRDYLSVPLSVSWPTPFLPALFVQSTVVSVCQTDAAIVDAGLKALATDKGEPIVASGAPKESNYQFMGDEHGKIKLPAGSKPLSIGDRIEWITPHCDPTVNLYNFFHCVRGNRLVAIWPIQARGH